MRRIRSALVALVAALGLTALLAPAAQASSFKISCAYDHTLTDDPIVFPGQPGASHSHDFFGNKTTNAYSTYDSLVGQATSCGNPSDTAAYWAPTLYYNGVAVHPSATAYYYNKYSTAVVSFPPGLKMIAGDSHATAPQSTKVVYFGCGSGSTISGVNYLPNCTGAGGPETLQIHVLFPDCWDQVGLGPLDVAYAKSGVCPAGYVRTPQLVLRLRYAIVDASTGVTLSSGPYYTMHADFINSWNQVALDCQVLKLNGGTC
jgi:hypothetical protein